MHALPLDLPPDEPAHDGASARLRTIRTVLVVCQDALVRELLATNLRAAGCFPLAVAHADEGRRLAAQVVPDVVVVDTDVADAAQTDWLLLSTGSEPGRVAHAILLSSRPVALGMVKTPAGTCLHIAKPFEPRELMRHILRLSRPTRPPAPRQAPRQADWSQFIEIDPRVPAVRIRAGGDWQVLELGWTDHRLLACLLAAEGRVRSRGELRQALWPESQADLRSVDQRVRRLRHALSAVGVRDLVKTVNGSGYQLDVAALTRSLPIA